MGKKKMTAAQKKLRQEIRYFQGGRMNEFPTLAKLITAWRDANPDEIPNLSKMFLEGAGFEKTNLSDTNFSGANLEQSSFRKSRLVGANFHKAYCYQTDFVDAILDLADFEKADLSDTNFEGASLRMVCFKDATCKQTSFYGATLNVAKVLEAYSLDGITLTSAVHVED